MRINIEVKAETSFKCKKGHSHVIDTENLSDEDSVVFVPDVCLRCENDCDVCEHLAERETVNICDMKDLRVELDRGKGVQPDRDFYRHIWNNEYLRLWIVYVDCQKEKLRVEKILKDSEVTKK